MKYNLKNIAILTGKVIVLLTIILIFSYVNIVYDKIEKAKLDSETEEEKKQDVIEECLDGIYNKFVLLKEKIYSIKKLQKDAIENSKNVKEGFGEEEEGDKQSLSDETYEKAMNGECVMQAGFVFKLPIALAALLIQGVIWVISWLISPIDWLLTKVFGSYYTALKTLFSTIYTVYKTVFDVCYTIIDIIFRIIFTIINIIIMILFAIMPNFLLNMFSIILAMPFVIIGLLLTPFANMFGFLGFICWSKYGFINEIVWSYYKIISGNFFDIFPTFDSMFD